MEVILGTLIGMAMLVSVLVAVFSSVGPYRQVRDVSDGWCHIDELYGLSARSLELPLNPQLHPGWRYATRELTDRIPNGQSLATEEIDRVFMVSLRGTVFHYNNAIYGIGTVSAPPLDLNGSADGTGCAPNTRLGGDYRPAFSMSPVGVQSVTDGANARIIQGSHLASNTYAGILIAITSLMPLGMIGFVVFKFVSDRNRRKSARH